MRSLKTIIILVVMLSCPALSGCFKVVPSVTSRKEANEKFLKISKEEYKLNVLTNALEHTLWIYLPTKENIIDYKATPDGPKHSNKSTEKWAINYLDSYFQTQVFYFEYDIEKKKNYSNDNGIFSSYNQEYSQTQNHLWMALSRSYTDLEKVPGDYDYFLGAPKDLSHKKLVNAYVKTEKPPDFIVMVISDIKKGIEVTTIFNFEDFKRTMTGEMPQEEFIKRNVSELTGNKTIIDDFEGKHLDYHDITWSEFLTKQALNRIRFKYQQSDFKPGDNTEEEIITIVAETFQAYRFGDFKSVELNNLAVPKTVIFEQRQLGTFMK